MGGGFLASLWSSIVAFINSLFSKSAATLPVPVTSGRGRGRPTSLSVKEPSPLDHSARSCRTRPSRRPLATPPDAAVTSTPSSPAVTTTTSDESFQVISLGDHSPPLSLADFPPLPSPWSPIGKTADPDAWMSVDGVLVNASGPVVDNPSQSQDDPPTLSFSSFTTSSALDALGISVFVDLDEAQDQGNMLDSRDAPATTPKLIQVRDENRTPLVTPGPKTPRKRRETISCVLPPSTHSARATKCLSTPLTKLDNVGVSHVRSATSISSMAYEFRMGLFADGRSITALENIISLLDQASPE